jgi:hypothetical protein
MRSVKELSLPSANDGRDDHESVMSNRGECGWEWLQASR